jgi:CDP-paratose 2-epimerase
MQQKKIVLYGDGRQVRDILYIDDLVNAFLLARKNISSFAGEVFNIGGGPENAISLLELLGHMRNLDHLNIQTMHDNWRVGDQKYYVTDIRKFHQKTGWRPKVSFMEGLFNLYNWLHQYHEENAETTGATI